MRGVAVAAAASKGAARAMLTAPSACSRLAASAAARAATRPPRPAAAGFSSAVSALASPSGGGGGRPWRPAAARSHSPSPPRRPRAPPAAIGISAGGIRRLLSAQPDDPASGTGAGSAKPPSASASASAPASAARDARLAGRRRFYKSAGISASANPPWDHFDPAALVELEKAQEVAAGGAEADRGMVDSPVSAGVDGTDSGTVGVSLERPTREAMQAMLAPRSASGSLGRLSADGWEPPRDDVETARGGGAEWYAVTLDGRPLRTPLGCPLLVPSPSLALAVASEWDAQTTVIQPAQMPLMTLVCTALDQTASDPETVIQNVLRYLRNDTTCYRSDPAEDRVLARKQGRAWDGLHAWVEGAFGVRPASAVGDEAILISRGTRSKLDRGYSPGLPHPPELEGRMEGWIRSMDAWHLTALQAATVEAKSLLVGAAVVAGAASHPGAPDDGAAAAASVQLPYSTHTRDAIQACRVEEEFQIENWGLVEGGHDYDRLNCSVGVHAASVLVRCVAADLVDAAAAEEEEEG